MNEPNADNVDGPASWIAAAPAADGPLIARSTVRRLLVPALFVVLALAIFFLVQSRASQSPISVGSCFEAPTDGEYSSVVSQDCGGPHGAEAFVAVDATGEPGSTAEDLCVAALLPLMSSYPLPQDFGLKVALIEDTTLCVLVSDSNGLVGSIAPNG